MGFFSLKQVCSICGNICGLNRYQIKDKGWCCPRCFKNAGLTLTSPIRIMSAEEIKNLIGTKLDYSHELHPLTTNKNPLPTNNEIEKAVEETISPMSESEIQTQAKKHNKNLTISNTVGIVVVSALILATAICMIILAGDSENTPSFVWGIFAVFAVIEISLLIYIIVCAIKERKRSDKEAVADKIKIEMKKARVETLAQNISLKHIVIALFVIIFITAAVVSLFTDESKTGSYDANYYEIENGYLMVGMSAKGVLKIPENYKSEPVLEISGFSGSTGRSITKIIGSKNLLEINTMAFASNDRKPMKNLTEVIFPIDANLKRIEGNAFHWQENLKTVILPQNFESFAVGAFYECYNLQNLVIYNTTPPDVEYHLFSGYKDSSWQSRPHENLAIFVPDESVDTYKSHSYWKRYTIKPISEADFIS